MPRSLLTIDSVKVHLRTGDVDRVRLGGRTDIFNHPEVKRYTDELNGKISAIEGEFEYKNVGFDFQISYATEASVEMGRVTVKKKGKATGDLELREEAFDFLREIYEEFFVDI